KCFWLLEIVTRNELIANHRGTLELQIAGTRKGCAAPLECAGRAERRRRFDALLARSQGDNPKRRRAALATALQGERCYPGDTDT
ncbi:MAG: hypothetical protein ACRD6N_06795, partial [Pyrinomonadaceae bacterium]